VTRAQIVQYLCHRGISWREDSSNASLAFDRNRIRHELLPQLTREWNPAIQETLNRAADWALAEEEYWEREIGRLAAGALSERDGAVLFRAADVASLPLAVARRLVRHAVARAKGDLRGVDFSHIAAILKLARSSLGHGRFRAPGVEAERSLDWVRLVNSGAGMPAPEGYRLEAPVPGVIQVPGTGSVIFLELLERAETSGATECVYNEGRTGCVDWHTLSGQLEVRNWMPGDRYRPVGSTGEVKIKFLFQKARIPRWERRLWPVLTDGSAIVWAGRFGVAARFRAAAGCARALRIREAVAR
jgi:tRNA(Ile)-lysidine synthase